MQRMHIRAMRSSPMELVGVHPTCLLTKTQSSFEEAHHWNIQAKFFSVRIPTQLCMNDMKISMEYKYTMEYECGSFKRNSSVAPFSLFISFFFLFSIFLYFFVASLALSIYLSFVLFGIFSCVLFWDLLFVSSLGSFPHFEGNTLYFTRMKRRSSHFTRSTQHKEN